MNFKNLQNLVFIKLLILSSRLGLKFRVKALMFYHEHFYFLRGEIIPVVEGYKN
jgi:hypothetical protein